MFVFFSCDEYLTGLDVAFRLSNTFKMSRIWFFILYGIIGTAWLTQQILISIFWRGVFIKAFDAVFCATSAPLWMYWGGLAAWDLFISSLLCYLFITRLWKAQKRRSSVSSNEGSKFLHQIAKFVTITIVGVMTTLITFVLVGFTSWISLVALDTCVNAWCVFLMYGKNKNLFEKLCFSCHKCVEYCCLGYVKIQRAIIIHKRKRRKHLSNNNKNENKNDRIETDTGTQLPKQVALNVPGGGDTGAGRTDGRKGKARNETIGSESSLTEKFPDFHEIFKLGRANDSTSSYKDSLYAVSPSAGSSNLGTMNSASGNGSVNDSAGDTPKIESNQTDTTQSTNNDGGSSFHD